MRALPCDLDGGFEDPCVRRDGDAVPALPLARSTTMADVQVVVGRQFGLSREDLRSPSRDAHLSWARHVAMFVARNETRASLPAIGAAFGNRGHTTVLHGIRRVSERAGADDEARRDVVDAFTGLWLRVVERRVHGRNWDHEVWGAEVHETTELARHIVNERYTKAWGDAHRGEATLPEWWASWTMALTVWLVLLETPASTSVVASSVGEPDTMAVVEAAHRVNVQGIDNPQVRDELVALVEALRVRRDPSSDRPAARLALSTPVMTFNFDAAIEDATLVCPACLPRSEAQKVTAVVCKYFDASPAALRWDDDDDMKWARDLTWFLVHAQRSAELSGGADVADRVSEALRRRVRNRLVHDDSARHQLLAILAELRGSGADDRKG